MARVSLSQPKPLRSWVANCWHRLLRAESRSKSQGARRQPGRFGRQALRPVVGDQQFHRVDAFEFGQEVFPAFDLLHGEVAAGDIQHGQAEQTLVPEQRGDQVVAALVEQRFVADRAGVIIRTTWRSTGPLLVAGSPICSQITTDSPSLTSLAR